MLSLNLSLWTTVVSILLISFHGVSSQIPTVCANTDSLRDRECCPDDCGRSDDRGECVGITSVDENSYDVRDNWPHYFRRVCRCNGNYSGYSCTRCKYGYYGANCSEFEMRPRRSTTSLSAEEWRRYLEILKATRNHPSGYTVVLNENLPGSTNLDKREIKLYNLFVWQHHYSAKNNECKGQNCTFVDYAHESTGFPTWHRQFILWFEWEVQNMLQDMGHPDYHTFRTHYWDWRDGNTDIFASNKLGIPDRTDTANRNIVTGDLFNDEWNTTCWHNNGIISKPIGAVCDPDRPTGPLRRCPLHDNSDPCASTNTDWPTSEDVLHALREPEYDADPYDKFARSGFRNFMEGFSVVDDHQECDNDDFCNVDENRMITRHLHNKIHIIVGQINLKVDPDMKGVMADVAASANDPLFINHHTMVDCLFEEWLVKNRNRQYPSSNRIKAGHRMNDYIVPFFPLYKHSDMFNTADNFGYSCNIISSPGPGPSRPSRPGSVPSGTVSLSNGIIYIAGIVAASVAVIIN